MFACIWFCGQQIFDFSRKFNFMDDQLLQKFLSIELFYLLKTNYINYNLKQNQQIWKRFFQVQFLLITKPFWNKTEKKQN